ncbi:MAG: hypothetical protein K2Y40_24745 [Reyranella sp.]|jgi:hypothetical protein|nr:hypothetical protein [Reyranella sp.]
MTVVAATSLTLGLAACGPDYLAEEVKKFATAAKTGNQAVQKASDAFASAEGRLAIASVANSGRSLAFNVDACRKDVTAENCRITVRGTNQSITLTADQKLRAVQYFGFVARYSELLAELLAAKTDKQLDELGKQMSATIKGIDSVAAGFSASTGGVIAGAGSAAVIALGKAIDDAIRLARVRTYILEADTPVRKATDYVTRRANNSPNLLEEFQNTIMSGATTDLNNRVRSYNVMSKSDDHAADRRSALEAIAAAQIGIVELRAVDLTQLAKDTLAAHDELVRGARENRMTLKELTSAIETLYKRAESIKQAVDKILGA